MTWDQLAAILAVATIVTSACVYIAVSISRMTLVLSQIAVELRSQRDLLVQVMRRNS